MSNKIIRLQELNKYNEKIKEYIKEKVGDNKPISTAATVESLISWKGTPLPTESGVYIDKVYLNKQLSAEEVKNILATLTWPISAANLGYTQFPTALAYPVMVVGWHSSADYKPSQIICLKKNNNYAIMLVSSRELYSNGVYHTETKKEMIFTTAANFDTFYSDFTGWNPSIDNILTVEAETNFGLNVTEHSVVAPIISLTPQEQSDASFLYKVGNTEDLYFIKNGTPTKIADAAVVENLSNEITTEIQKLKNADESLSQNVENLNTAANQIYKLVQDNIPVQDRTGKYIKNINFNTQLSVAEVKNLLNQLDFIDFDGEPLYPIAVNENLSSVLAVMKLDFGTSIEYYMMGFYYNEKGEEISVMPFATFDEGDPAEGGVIAGWQPNFDGTFPFNDIAVTEVMGFSFNDQNDLLEGKLFTTEIGGETALRRAWSNEINDWQLFHTKDGQEHKVIRPTIIDVQELPTYTKHWVWSGVPVDTIYFNTDMTIDEVKAQIDRVKSSDNGSWEIFYSYIGDIKKSIVVMKERVSDYVNYTIAYGVMNATTLEILESVEIFSDSKGWLVDHIDVNNEPNMNGGENELFNEMCVNMFWMTQDSPKDAQALYRLEENGQYNLYHYSNNEWKQVGGGVDESVVRSIVQDEIEKASTETDGEYTVGKTADFDAENDSQIPTSKAVADYVAEQVSNIDIPEVDLGDEIRFEVNEDDYNTSTTVGAYGMCTKSDEGEVLIEPTGISVNGDLGVSILAPNSLTLVDNTTQISCEIGVDKQTGFLEISNNETSRGNRIRFNGYDYEFPNQSGEIALLDDIPSTFDLVSYSELKQRLKAEKLEQGTLVSNTNKADYLYINTSLSTEEVVGIIEAADVPFSTRTTIQLGNYSGLMQIYYVTANVTTDSTIRIIKYPNYEPTVGK